MALGGEIDTLGASCGVGVGVAVGIFSASNMESSSGARMGGGAAAALGDLLSLLGWSCSETGATVSTETMGRDICGAQNHQLSLPLGILIFGDPKFF